MSNTDKKEPFDWFNVVFGIIVLVIFIIWYTNFKIGETFTVGMTMDKAGQFGDRFGMATSIFGGITIVFLMYTIRLQRKEITLNREAIDLTRKEMELTKLAVEQSANELKKQSKQLSYQRFDNTFFNLIDLSNEVIKNLPHQRTTFIEVATRLQNHAFTGIETYENLYQNYNQRGSGANGHSMAEDIEDLFGHYLKNFEEIIYFIYNKKKSEKVSTSYYHFYFSQIGNYERVILLFHFGLIRNPPPPLRECQHILFMPLEKSTKILPNHYSVLYNHLVEYFYP